MSEVRSIVSRQLKGKSSVVAGNNSNPLGNEIIKSKEIIKGNDATSSQPDEKAIEQARAALEKTKISYEHAKKALALLTGKTPKAPSAPGVISSILDILKKSPKGVTKDEILAELVILFPERPKDGMFKTIGVQLPSRLSKEKGVNIVRDNGKFFLK